jgi:Gamma-glutamyl cyclotransferase, AIG2-like
MKRARCARLSREREAAFFFYGTLMDCNLLSGVLGRRVAPRALLPARLLNHRRAAVRGAAYPVVLFRRGASVRGVVLRRVKPTERVRLCAYEGDGYGPVCAMVELPGERRVQVFLFKPKPGAYTISSRPWSLGTWRLHYKRLEIAPLTKDFLAAPPP